MLVVANRHARGLTWTLVDIATFVFSGAACVQALVRWLLWVGRKRDVASRNESLGHGQRLPAVGMGIGASRPGSPGLRTELVSVSGAE